MNKFEMIRGALNFVVTLGVGNIVTDALKKVQPTQAQGALRKLTTKVGGLAIGLYASDKIGNYVDKGFCNLVGQKDKVQEVKTEIVEEIKEDEA